MKEYQMDINCDLRVPLEYRSALVRVFCKSALSLWDKNPIMIVWMTFRRTMDGIHADAKLVYVRNIQKEQIEDLLFEAVETYNSIVPLEEQADTNWIFFGNYLQGSTDTVAPEIKAD